MHALGNAIAAALYVVLVATILANGGELFGTRHDPTFAAVGILMLFVLSAAVMGILMFGRPLMWYLDGKKREAVSLAISTVAFFAMITAGLFISLALF